MPRIFGKKTGVKLSLVLLLSFLFLFVAASTALAATYGDINDDGKIDVQDVSLAMRHVLELKKLTAAQEAVADVNGDGKINAQDVTLIMQHSLGLIKEFPHAALKVSKVSAVNPKQVEVEFSRVLNDQEKAKMVKANFHVGLQAAPGTNRLTGDDAAVAIKEDDKTVLLTIGDGHVFVNGSTTNRVIVKKAVGLDADFTKNDVAFFDNAVPTLVSVHSDGPRSIVLTFSEPLDKSVTPTNIKLNDGAISLDLSNVVYVDAKRELKIKTYSDLAAGSHTLAIESGTSLKDYSDFKVSPVSKTFTHTPVTTPPTVSVKSSTETSVTIEFSRPINKDTLLGNSFVLFRHTYDTTINEVTGATIDAVKNPSGDSKTFIINFGTRLLPPGTTTMWMKYAESTADVNKIKDTWGNIVPPATLTVNTVPDTTAPTATVKMAPGSNKVIEIVFSKPVTGATTPGNFVLRKGSTSVSFTGPVYDSASGKYKITSVQAMQGAHTLTISNIKDTTPAQNPLGTQTYNINVPDIIAPQVTEVRANTAAVADATAIYVSYDELMGPSVLERENYRLVVGTTQYLLLSGTKITQSGNTVKIAFPEGKKISDISSSITDLFIGNVKDVAGNSIEAFKDHAIKVKEPVNFAPKTVTVHSAKQVSFVVNRQLKNAEKEKIKFDGNEAENVSYVNNPDHGTATVTATFADDVFETYIASPKEEINILEGALTDANDFVNAAKDVEITVDKAAPALLSATVVTGGTPARIQKIILKYSEGLYAASVQETDYSVTGYTITSVTVDGVDDDEVTLNVTGGTGITTTVTQVGAIQDLASPRNTLSYLPAFTVPTSP